MLPMPTGYRYRPMSGFGSSTSKDYGNNDKRPSGWQLLLYAFIFVLGIGVLIVGLFWLTGGL